MKQIILKKGQILVENTPTPVCGEGNVLVKNLYSLISAGTEITSINFSKDNIIKKALNYPDKINKGFQILKRKGIVETFKLAQNFLDFPTPLGYSCAGEVLEVGKHIPDIKVGDLVACTGSSNAHHAEIVSVPRNLLVKIPNSLDPKLACSAGVGAIALHSVRQLDPKIGETVAVIGLGLIGNLVMQILKANGNRVISIDIDNTKLKKAKELGSDFIINSSEKNVILEIQKITNNLGVDGTIISASTKGNELLDVSLGITRRKGCVVVLGAIGLLIHRNQWYEKEIDLKISCSLGPGRYDENYENKGIDYPYNYVRWTENRNMEAYLELLRSRKVDFNSLINEEFLLDKANTAYQSLANKPQPLAVLFKYDSIIEDKEHILTFSPKANTPINGRIRVALIGVGNFMMSTHIPNLLKLKDIYEIKGVCVDNSVKANEWAKKLGAIYACTDYRELLTKPDIDLFIVGTRHNTHYEILMEMLKANKNVLIEKPLCLDEKELDEIVKALENKNNIPIISGGFNRRYSPIGLMVKDKLKNRTNPIMINCRINDEYLPSNHWVNTAEGGGRIVGNAVHMFDLFNFLIGSEVLNISANSINSDYYSKNDNFVAQIKYKDGSIANITYTTLGNNKLAKEYIEIFGEGKSFVINDFKTLKIYGGSGSIKHLKPNKGHFEELQVMAQSLKDNTLPAPIQDLIQASKISFEIQKQVNNK